MAPTIPPATCSDDEAHHHEARPRARPRTGHHGPTRLCGRADHAELRSGGHLALALPTVPLRTRDGGASPSCRGRSGRSGRRSAVRPPTTVSGEAGAYADVDASFARPGRRRTTHAGGGCGPRPRQPLRPTANRAAWPLRHRPGLAGDPALDLDGRGVSGWPSVRQRHAPREAGSVRARRRNAPTATAGLVQARSQDGRTGDLRGLPVPGHGLGQTHRPDDRKSSAAKPSSPADRCCWRRK